MHKHANTPLLASRHPPLLGKGGLLYQEGSGKADLLETTGALPALPFDNIE